MDIANAVSRRRRKVWETILAFTCVDVRLCILLLILVMRKGYGLNFVEQEFLYRKFLLLHSQGHTNGCLGGVSCVLPKRNVYTF